MNLDELVNQLLDINKKEEQLTEKQEYLLVVNEIFDQIENLRAEADRLNELKKSVNEQITTAFREIYNGINDVFEIEGVRIKYTPPTTRKSVDVNVLKATYPKIYTEVLRESPIKDKVTITFKKPKVKKELTEK